MLTTTEQNLTQRIRELGGMVKTSTMLNEGYHYRILASLVKKGVLEQVVRGVYRLSDMPSLSYSDLSLVALQTPDSVICLISALSFHEITTEIPSSVDIALDRFAGLPAFKYPPISVHLFSEKALSAGVEIHDLDEIEVKIFSVEKTLADCFYFRNQIGISVFIEAIKMYFSSRRPNIDKLHEYARIWRVEKGISPYIQALI